MPKSIFFPVRVDGDSNLKRSYPVKREVLSCETEVLFRETVFH